MAVPKVMGVETEYGIISKGGEDSNPILASSILINSFASPRLKRVRWDYDEESPLRDARGFDRPGGEIFEADGSLISVILENGARYYVDHAHPEYCTPECANARDLVIHDKAGEAVLAASLKTAAETLPAGERILVYKNNSDGKGNSYGCHENYMVSRATPFGNLVKTLVPFFVSRQIFTGSGKLGSEGPSSDVDVKYQISQRSDFFEVEVGLETTFKRPIINTRDEPHSDPDKYRRLHVIIGDANMSEVATFLKVGCTAIVLRMIEDEFITGDFGLEDAVGALKTVSRDPTCRAKIRLAGSRTITAVDLQWEFLGWAKKYLAGQDDDQVTEEVMARWEEVLNGLESDPMTLDRQLDWVAKFKVIDAYQQRQGVDWNDPRLALVDLQYHDVRPEKGVYHKLLKDGRMDTIASESEIQHALSNPPNDTRAYFRGSVLKKFSSDVTAASWDSMMFDTGADSLKKVSMMEPLRGTRETTGELIATAQTSAELLEGLEG